MLSLPGHLLDTLVMLLQFSFGFIIIVGIHELGHLLLAKYFGMRVEGYSIGFPPTLFRFTWGETEYSLGLIPLGGAARISGMVDESLATNDLPSRAEPWEFRAKPAWQRLCVILGGILFNVLLGVTVFIGLTFYRGDQFLPKATLNSYGIWPSEEGLAAGFQVGDKILAIDGQDYQRFADLFLTKSTEKAAVYTVERGTETQLIRAQAATGKGEWLFTPLLPTIIAQVVPDGAAHKAGLQIGDQLLRLNEHPIRYFQQLADVQSGLRKQMVTLQYVRDGEARTTQLQLSGEGKMGIQLQPLAYQRQAYSVPKGIHIGIKQAFYVVWANAKGIYQLVTGKASITKSLSGPIGIARLFGKHFVWENFWQTVAILAMVLAFMNILPIPALDGGHAVLILFEMFTGHAPSHKWQTRLQLLGMLLLLLLMGVAFFSDIKRFF